ncbi:hypothetical protein V8J88_20640 [Massilia sp. W12]|uniref:hypothetical protein n=1 Tax=Massilia sp. W12 TaxID=3126507 RepID=UPI0030CBA7D1
MKRAFLSIKKRKIIEESFGWAKTIGGLHKTRFVGLAKIKYQMIFTFAVYKMRIDAMPELREKYGSSLIAANMKSQLLLLKGDDFLDWGASEYFVEDALLPIFHEQADFDLSRPKQSSADPSYTCKPVLIRSNAIA